MNFKKINKLFIANRGEILRRIAYSAKKMGIATCCIVEAGRKPEFLSGLIDDTIVVEHEDTALYLNGEKIIALAQERSCDAIHPGFGFLSENHKFAQMIIDAGMVWVGPAPMTIEQMADKGRARMLAIESGVPCTQGLKDISPDKAEDINSVKDFVKSVGFPILIKAALGGGGKGMRLVHSLEEVEPALKRAHSEAISFFQDGSLIVEQYIERSRHIEVQILGDSHGQVIHLGDRDCSLQRRHQKIIEEAPAPTLSDKIRNELHRVSLELAKKVNYISAGTIEYLFDPNKGNEGAFYFLEMNTRLQVEHPVTEEVFGVDLVEWQLHIAQGEKIDDDLKDRKPRGHAIEARLYGENPFEQFLPAPGPVYFFKPFWNKDIRWEIGLDECDEITSKFDPMISKIIGKGCNRRQAWQSLETALQNSILLSNADNREYLTWFCQNSEVDWWTSYIDEHNEDILCQVTKQKEQYDDYWKILKKKFLNQSYIFEGTSNLSQGIANIDSVTENAFSALTKQVQSMQQIPDSLVKISKSWSQYTANKERIVQGAGEINEQKLDSTSASFTSFNFVIYNGSQKKIFSVNFGSYCFKVEIDKNISILTEGEGKQHENEVRSHVPGKVILIKAEVGQKVETGQTLCVIESMKMELEIKSKSNGKIEKIHIAEGSQVNSGQLLFALEMNEVECEKESKT